ncbi:DUF2884 family protein [Thalassotalea marina]|uniref:DUF2884 family protein n=1 Tax=Thalassotalea marina TaxID=1673741 RepID=A0A919BL47_9GAMM|nr:DUF2884 family protein [Thalassotalea marina]GHF96346.1 hypothetical protein GCM10017161_25880 [Thalassotalea marina]
MKQLNFNQAILACAVSAIALSSTQASANAHCDINFRHGVIIDPLHIRILEQGITFVQINHDRQLFVQGREVYLSDQQTHLVKQYATGIREQVPEIVSIAIESVDVGLNAVNKVVASVTGENSSSHQRLQKKFDELQWRLKKRFKHSDDSFYIAPQDFDELEEVFAGAFEQEIEALVTESIGTMLGAVGQAIEDTRENNERREESFEQRMESMGDVLELEISSDVNIVEQKTIEICEKLIALDSIETALNENIDQLSSFNLIQAH